MGQQRRETKARAPVGRWSVAAGLAFVLVASLTSCGDDPGIGLFEAQAAAATGPAPFTDSVAAEPTEQVEEFTDTGAMAGTPATEVEPSAATEPVEVAGDATGLYGGTENEAQCDRQQLITYLTEDEEKGAAWAQVQGIDPADLPAYINGLTPLVLTQDTLVTNHGYEDGQATPFLSLMQRGTAVLVDAQGVPRARCYCGNPLLPPTEYVPPPGVEITTTTSTSTTTTSTTAPTTATTEEATTTTVPEGGTGPTFTIDPDFDFCDILPFLCDPDPPDDSPFDDIPWETFNPATVQVIMPAPQPVQVFEAVDLTTGALTEVEVGSSAMGEAPEEEETEPEDCIAEDGTDLTDVTDENGLPVCTPDTSIEGTEDTVTEDTVTEDTVTEDTVTEDTEAPVEDGATTG
jgi:hypothetical protein